MVSRASRGKKRTAGDTRCCKILKGISGRIWTERQGVEVFKFQRTVGGTLHRSIWGEDLGRDPTGKLLGNGQREIWGENL